MKGERDRREEKVQGCLLERGRGEKRLEFLEWSGRLGRDSDDCDVGGGGGWGNVERRLPRGYVWKRQWARRKKKKTRAIGGVIM